MNHTLKVTDQSLINLKYTLHQLLQNDDVVVLFPNPQSPSSYYEGEVFELGGDQVRFRSLRAWLELSEILGVTFHLEHIDLGWCTATLRRSNTLKHSWHRAALSSGHTEKYGTMSDYSRINKLEEPHILNDLTQAFSHLQVPLKSRILAMGCNQGDEIFAFWQQMTRVQKDTCHLMGIDHSKSAIEQARLKYPQLSFHIEDVNHIDSKLFGELDVLIALNILHSPSLNGHLLFKTWVKSLLKTYSSVIVGLPNCRYHGYELRFGAVTKHHRKGQDRSLMLSDAQFYMRYLRQQGFNVVVTGHYTTLIIGKRGPIKQNNV